MNHKVFYALLSAIFLLCSSAGAQKVVSGKSKPKAFKMDVSYQRDLPPDLYADLEFNDENGNGVLEAEEEAELRLTLTNKGKGVAQALRINVIDELINDPELNIDGERKLHFLKPEESQDFVIPINAGFFVRSAEHKFKITVDEHFGYNMDPAFLVMNTLEYQKPELVFAGYEIIDVGEGTFSRGNPDGQLQLGEQVKVKVSIQNIGQNVARNVTYKVINKDHVNVFMEDQEGTLDDLKIGQVKEILLDVSPNKLIDPNQPLPLFMTLKVDKNIGGFNDFQLPILPNQKPPETNIVEVKPDRVKLQNQARFETTGKKFSTRVGNLKDIRQVPRSEQKRYNSVAVIFGIENYEDLPPAPYAENDANIIEDYFEQVLGIEEVVTYTSKEARGFVFPDVFDPETGDLQRAIDENTDVFVFYSGHGVPSKDGKDVYILPSDGHPSKLEQQGFHINTLYENLEAMGAKSINVFLDACFTGASKESEKLAMENLTGEKGAFIEPQVIKPWERNPNFSVFTSSSYAETSLAFDASQTGLFTYYLCVGLQGDADANADKKITMGELYDFVKDEVVGTSRKISGTQTPEFHGNPDIVLVEL